MPIPKVWIRDATHGDSSDIILVTTAAPEQENKPRKKDCNPTTRVAECLSPFTFYSRQDCLAVTNNIPVAQPP
jgi:hypothetical protein